MGVAAGIILALGTAASAGIQAKGAHDAGKASQAAAGSAAKQFRKTGERASGMLEKYEELLAHPDRLIWGSFNANKNNLRGANWLSQSINTFNKGELDRMMQMTVPGYKKSIRLALKNTRSWIKGQVPEDVSDYVENRAAEKANRFGLGSDTVARRSLTARDLGRTSLDLMREGENSLQRWISTARQNLIPTLHDPMEFLLTPTQYTNDIIAASNIAGQRAGILTGAQNTATNAYLQGEQAKISADQAMMQALAQGLESIAGVAAGGMTGGTAGGSMGGARPNTAGWQTGPQPGTFYVPQNYGRSGNITDALTSLNG